MRIPTLVAPTGSPLMHSRPEIAGTSPRQAAFVLEEFLNQGRTTAILSGAGISVDSNIPDYRGPSGTYTLNNCYRPIFFQEFVTRDKARRRYWARSFLGYPPVAKAKPNLTHKSLAKLQLSGFIRHHITQNVDGLMNKAFAEEVRRRFNESKTPPVVFELHGTLQEVICLYCRRKSQRDHIQAELERLNPKWRPLLDINSRDLKLNADGDVDIRTPAFESTELQYRNFRYPPCPHCLAKYGDSDVLRVDEDGAWNGGTAGVVKPAVIFFGENVSNESRQAVEKIVKDSDQLLIVGTTLAVLSAQRLVRNAKADRKRIAIVTAGYVRNEEHLVEKDDIRIWWRSSDVLEAFTLP